MAGPTPDGFVLVDKPAGISSHDAINRVRRSLGSARAGHAGTLDPFATGLLVVASGSATRLLRFVPGEPKVYLAHVVFGVATDSDDATGNVIGRGPVPDDVTVRQAIGRLTGSIDQVPPAFSARHVAGRRAYAIAREGGAPDLAPARVTVHSWDVHALSGGILVASITCGSGTYVRALARDLGRLCGTVAHLGALRRVRAGNFSVDDAVPPDEAGSRPLIPPVDALGELPRQVVGDAEASLVRHGRAIPATAPGETAALVGPDGNLLAVAERDGTCWQPRVVLAGA